MRDLFLLLSVYHICRHGVDDIYETFVRITFPDLAKVCTREKKKKMLTFISVLLLIHDQNNFNHVISQGCPALHS